ncbi:MAG: D-alanine--D-alanine ligase [Desulfobacteraceae bacterium]
MEKITLALLAGGISSEREVSLNSGEQVYEALDKSKYDIRRYDPKSDLAKLVADAGRIDAALIILHGPYGEDGTVQGLLDLLDIPYQGSGVLGSAVAMNKLVAKQLYEFAGLPVAPYAVVHGPDHMTPDATEKQLGLPVVIKPIEAGSSVGMSIVRTKEALSGALETAFEHSRSVMIEAYVQGIEVTCGVLGNDTPEALPLIEIIPDAAHDFFDYEAKYTAGVTKEICPARISEALTAQAQHYALQAHAALQCRGYSRTDMMLREDRFYLLETNTIPGMTATSLFPQAAKVAGYDFSPLLDKLIQLSIEDHQKGR